MAIYLPNNQYRGVNAHFQSTAQWERDGWSSFHTTYIADLFKYLARILPPHYEPTVERSLQIRIHDPMENDSILSKRAYPIPDVTIWQVGTPAIFPSSAFTPVATPTMVDALYDTLERDEDQRISAVTIREKKPDGLESVPIARFELLSPTNKVAASKYVARSETALESGTVLIEIDFLHETDSPLVGIPSYVRQQPNAFPYLITVSDPRPTVEQGNRERYGFFVDKPMLPIPIKLAWEDVIAVDFLQVYNLSFNHISTYFTRANYAKEPFNFHTYSQADQKRIWARMVAVVDAVRMGQDLTFAPFPIPTPETDAAFALLEATPFQQASLLIAESSLTAYWLIHTARHELLQVERRLETEQNRLQTSVLAQGTETEISAAFQTAKSHFEQTGQFV